MYTIAIVDDEKIIRDGLLNNINWEKLGFQVMGTYADGFELIEALEYGEPDVILTDMKMQHIDGMGIAKYVQENGLHSRVICLSAYQEFTLAQQSMKYGAVDYLLKPLDKAELARALERCKAELDRDCRNKDGDRNLRSFVMDQFVVDLVIGLKPDRNHLKRVAGMLWPQIDLDQSPCFLASLTLEDYASFLSEKWEKGLDDLEAKFKRVLSEVADCPIHVVFKKTDCWILLGFLGNSYAEEGSNTVVSRLAGQIGERLSAEIKWEVLRDFQNIYEINMDVLYDRTGRQNEETKKILDEQKKLMLSYIRVGNITSGYQQFQNILTEMHDADKGQYTNVVIDLLSSIKNLVYEINEKLGTSLQPLLNYNTVISLDSREKQLAYCRRIFDCLLRFAEKGGFFESDSLITLVRKYIADNVSMDISLEMVAEQFQLSSTYLSKLFHKKTGEKFSDYVLRTKMEQAILLLQNPLNKMYQVGEAVGYKTSKYFSKVFRNHTGMTPSEYREKVLFVEEA